MIDIFVQCYKSSNIQSNLNVIKYIHENFCWWIFTYYDEIIIIKIVYKNEISFLLLQMGPLMSSLSHAITYNKLLNAEN